MKKECENKLSIAAVMEANGNAVNNRLAKEYVAPDTRRTRIETEGSFCGSGEDIPTGEEGEPSVTVTRKEVGAESDYFNGTDENGNKFNDVYSDETDGSQCNSTYYALNDRDITNIYRFVPTGSGFKAGSSVNVWKQCLQRLEPIDGINSITGFMDETYGKDEIHWPTWFKNSTPNRIETKKDKIVKMIQQAVLQYT